MSEPSTSFDILSAYAVHVMRKSNDLYVFAAALVESDNLVKDRAVLFVGVACSFFSLESTANRAHFPSKPLIPVSLIMIPQLYYIPDCPQHTNWLMNSVLPTDMYRKDSA